MRNDSQNKSAARYPERESVIIELTVLIYYNAL